MDNYGQDAKSWRNLLNDAEQQDGSPGTIIGFLMALYDCCLAKRCDAAVPDFVIDALEKLIASSAEEDRALEDPVRQDIRDAQVNFPQSAATLIDPELDLLRE